jgi:hypothetical protein
LEKSGRAFLSRFQIIYIFLYSRPPKAGFFIKTIIMKIIPAAIGLVFMLASCGGSVNRKVIVYSNGTPTIQENTITLTDRSGHNEVEFFPTDKTITVKFPDNVTQSFTVDGDGTDGLYILNLKKDTLIGSFQPVGAESKQETISQENLKYRIDSLQQLMAGKNVSEAKRNFFIPPNQIKRISANEKAQIVGPFMRMPGSFSGTPEVYKFYTNGEVRETIVRLEKMVAPAPEEEN